MRKVTVDELLPLGAYEQVRERFRQRVIAHKKARRVFLGPDMTVLFEDHETALLQVQEMLRAERVTAPRAVREELESYNELVPPDGALRATLMIELEDADERERVRRELVGLDERLHLALGDRVVRAEFDAYGRFDDRIAVVRYVTFPMPDDGRAALLDLAREVRLVVDHPRYQATAALSEATRRSLADDLDPESAERRVGARDSRAD
jgi:hypothetical protein